ncbi:MAG: hypothetical protein U9O95_04435 [Candidatus Marinimicrobia bacterium]|nr:hypothetical protein [Candidatus Neomarinimicrobiota bacterium]
MANNKKQRYYFLTFFLILFIGSTGVFLTKTDVGFNIVYKILRQQISSKFNYQLSIKDMNTPVRTSLEASYLEFSNEDSTIILTIDTLNINYKGIFELFGRRHLDSLHLVEPQIYIKLGEGNKKGSGLPEINFPNFLVNTIKIDNAKLQIETPDTLIDQTIDHLQFHYSGRRGGAVLAINDLKLKNEALGIDVKGLSSEIVFKNNIAKLHNLNFIFNDSRITSNGKIRYVEPFRFQFAFNIQDFAIEDYIELPVIKENDKIDLDLDIMGDFKVFTATIGLKGTLNDRKIDYSTLNLEYKDDYLHLLQATFKNQGTDISVYGSYGIKDKYITTTFSSYALTPSDWLENIPDFDFQGRLRATGYLEERLKINYDFDCKDLFGLETATLNGNILLHGLNEIVLDSSNLIYLPDGLLKARGTIKNLKNVDLDIYGNITSLNDLEIPNIGEIKADDIYLTLKILGEIKDPDIQMNFNLDTLKYETYTVNNLNVSLFSNKTISQPGGAVLVSFENATIDSFMIGSLQSYIRVEENMVYLDYLDLSHENYLMNMSGSIKDLKEFTVQTLKGQYQGEDIYLLDPVTFTLSDDGYSLSRYDILYRDALLYGSLDVKNDLIDASMNIAGAELNSLPLISTIMDSVSGILDMNLDITGTLNDPEIRSGLVIKKAHAFGLDMNRIRSDLYYIDSMAYINDFRFDISDNRKIALKGRLPLSVNLHAGKIVEMLPQDSLYVDLDVKNVWLSKLLPFIFKKIHIAGNASTSGTITGTINDPIMNANMFIDDPVVMKIEGDSIKGMFHYRNERIFFNDVDIFADNGRYQGNANFFMDLRFQPEAERFSRDSSLYVYVQGTDDEMIYLTPFIDLMESFNADLYTELEITGNFKEPIKNGRVTVKDGHLVLGILGNEIENLEGGAIMKDNIMDVELKGKLSSVSYTLAGILGLEKENINNKYNFDLSGDMDMRYLIRPQFNLQLTGDQMSIVTLNENINLTTGAVDLAITGRDTLTVSGDATVREGLIEFGLNRAAQEAVASTEQRRRIKTAYSINAIIDKVYFRNQFIDATLNGEMILQKFASEDRTKMGGELFVTEGFFNYWASVFVLDEGSLILDQFDNNHRLNIIANKEIENGDNEIIASITGELNNPEITFSDKNNEKSQAEIVQVLTVGEIASVLDGVVETGIGSEGNNFNLGSAATALLTLAEVPLEQQARKLGGVGGLDRIDIKGGTEGTYIDETTALVIGGRIGRNFYLTYEGSQSDLLNIEYEYRLNNKVSIVGKANEEQVGGAIRLRLQY